MKANELMIGDWVLCDRNAQSDYEFDNVDYQPYQIANGEDIDYAFEQNMIGDADVYQPIPLTTEILEKNGFKELMSESEISAERFGRKPGLTGVWQYGFGRFDSVSYVPKRSFLSVKFMEGCQTDIANIKYVHELQHALRLCGVEKDIAL